MAALPTLPSQDDIPLYRPPNPEATPAFRFLNRINSKFCLSLASYHDLYTWSITHIDDFWSTVWDETDVIGHKGHHVVDRTALPPTNPTWFGSHLDVLASKKLIPSLLELGSPMPRLTGRRICCNVAPTRKSPLFKPVRVIGLAQLVQASDCRPLQLNQLLTIRSLKSSSAHTFDCTQW